MTPFGLLDWLEAHLRALPWDAPLFASRDVSAAGHVEAGPAVVQPRQAAAAGPPTRGRVA